MERKRSWKWLKVTLSVVAIVAVFTTYKWYAGTYTWKNVSPDGEYELRYYSTFDFSLPRPFTSCSSVWVRLYNKKGKKLEELLRHSCGSGGRPTRWHIVPRGTHGTGAVFFDGNNGVEGWDLPYPPDDL